MKSSLSKFLPCSSITEMRVLLVVFVCFNTCVLAQTDKTIGTAQLKLRTELLKSYKPSGILVGVKDHHYDSDRKIRIGDERPIVVSTSVFNEVGTAITSVYNISNRLTGIKIGNQNKQGINLNSNVGIKGWEANAVGSFSKKRSSTFNLSYQYSVENLLMQGLGHRVRFVTNF